MLLTGVDPGDPMPLHLQITGAIRRAIGEGELRAGERLPPARDLAAACGVNTNTVLRALRDLRDDGLLEFRRGPGVRVREGPPGRALLQERVLELVRLSEQHGYSREEIVSMVEEAP